MYYYLFPFIYKKINNEFYYLNERENKLVRTVLEYHRFNTKITKMSLSILMKYGNYELINFIEKNKTMINEYFEYFIKENTNG